jgi:hypothetical protein
MNTSFYTLSLEELMERYQIWFSCYPMKKSKTDKLGMPYYESSIEWRALMGTKLSVEGRGTTPREAVIDLSKKLKM